MSHLDHPVKAEKVSTLNFADCRQAEIHATGCAHEAKAVHVFPHTEETKPTADDVYTDDWYHVAPCARKAA